MAMVAIAPGMFLAQSVVPSSGSTAMSTLGPSLLRSRRMASTAAWSAAVSLPRPVHRAAETAARSVTRTISRVRTRSSARSDWMVINGTRPSLLMSCALLPTRYGRIVSVFFDPDDLRFARDHLVAPDRGERLAHRVLGG